MCLSHLVMCCLAMHTVTGGRILRATIGQNTSLSFSINTMRHGMIIIKHENTNVIHAWPYNNFIRIEQPDRVGVSVDNKTASNTIMVTVNILNITQKDVGMYSVVDESKPLDVLDSLLLLLDTIGVDHTTTDGSSLIIHMDVIEQFTSEATLLTKETEGIIHYTKRSLSMKENTEGPYYHTSAATAPKDDIQDVPSERHLMYIIFGMGALLAAAFLAFLLHKRRICFRVDRRSISNAVFNSACESEDRQDVNEFGHYYWTIVSNAEGELGTAIDMKSELRREPLLTEPSITRTKGTSDESIKPDDIKSIQELDGYLNPINSGTVEFDGYIHPVHSDNENPCYSTDI